MYVYMLLQAIGTLYEYFQYMLMFFLLIQKLSLASLLYQVLFYKKVIEMN